eukprot:TRINITY_DN4615_c0_g2_i2.p1 TRINITY_DN4615_c0_g2~~TRINITY_DN4615_c0_g2_i2.p1  ORF type:complete len:348 (+),score=57.52 TRINITY_DN4615_c0_g2_i2:140-1183(+)
MKEQQLLFLGLLAVLLFTTAHGQFVPTMLACGTASDVKAVTKFPHSITSVTDELTSTITTWNAPVPFYNATCVYSGVTVSYLARQVTFFREIDGTVTAAPDGSFTTEPEVFKSVYLGNLTWETSATKIDSCEGFYLRTTLDNGGILEFVYYTYHEAHQITYSDRTFTLKKGQTQQNYYISNYTYSQPNVSAIQFQMYTRFPGSLDDFGSYSFPLGASLPGYDFRGEEQNTTNLNIRTPPHNARQIGPAIEAIVIAFTYVDYSLLDLTKKRPVVMGVDINERTGAGILSIDITETHIGPFSGIDDTFLFIGRMSFGYMFAASEADGDDSGSMSLLEKSIFSRALTLLI